MLQNTEKMPFSRMESAPRAMWTPTYLPRSCPGGSMREEQVMLAKGEAV